MMTTPAIKPKAYAKILARCNRMDQLGLGRFVAQTSALMFVWMTACFSFFLWVFGRWQVVVREGLVLWTFAGFIVLLSVVFAVFQWTLTHRLIRNAGAQG